MVTVWRLIIHCSCLKLMCLIYHWNGLEAFTPTVMAAQGSCFAIRFTRKASLDSSYEHIFCWAQVIQSRCWYTFGDLSRDTLRRYKPHCSLYFYFAVGIPIQPISEWVASYVEVSGNQDRVLFYRVFWM